MLIVLCTSAFAHHSLAANPVRAIGYGNSVRDTQWVPGSSHDPGTRGLIGANYFSISGTMKGLYPGVTLPLVLTIANPAKIAITVTAIATTVGSSGSCAAANVKVTSFNGQLHVGAGMKAQVAVHVTMAKSAPNACQGALFPFKYTGTATES